MKKYINISLLVVLLLMTTSCNKWLNINPKSQVEGSRLLTNERGYNSALAGIYYRLSSEALYGKELTYGAIDVLAQYWNVSTSTKHSYYAFQKYDFTNTNSIKITDAYWANLYAGIAQANNILESLEINRGSIDQSQIMEAEAYALRGYMHFELLKLFGPVLQTKADQEKPAIPYRTKFNVDELKFASSKVVMENVMKDLERALVLLESDPIKVDGREGDGNESLLQYNNVLKRRGTRMNYYAVLGIMARVELYRGEKSAAYTYANRLLNECAANMVGSKPVIRLNEKEIFNNTQQESRDIICQDEFLFAVYMEELYKITGPIFGYKGFELSTDNLLYFSADDYSNILNFVYGRTPDGAGTDYRLKYWFGKHENTSGNESAFLKLKEPKAAGGMPAPYAPEMPLMKLSEIYYIACECQIGVNNVLALDYLNKVRDARGLPAITDVPSDEMLEEYLTREMRKDMFGEGQMFTYYKRKFKQIDVSSKLTIGAQLSIFVLPIPDSEYEFSPNVKPTENK